MKKKIIIIVVAIVVIILAIFAYQTFMSKNGGSLGGNTDYSLTNILKKKKIVLATFPELSPFTFKEGAKNIGYDLDLMNEIAKEIGVSIEIKEMTFPELFDAVKSKQADLAISSITITEERKKTTLFSIPYFTSGQSIIVRSENNTIKKVEDLKDKKVTALSDSTCAEAVAPYLTDPKTQLVVYPNFTEEIDVLKKGEVEAIIHDYAVTAYMVKNDPELKLIGDPFTQEYYGIMTNLENKALMDKINELLRNFKRDGKIKELDAKWFGK